MKTSIYTKVSINIIIIFVTIIASSLIPDYFPNLFGDWLCQGSIEQIQDTYYYKGCNYANEGFHNSQWHWGYRHWIWMCMGLSLFIVQVVRIIVLIDKKD